MSTLKGPLTRLILAVAHVVVSLKIIPKILESLIGTPKMVPRNCQKLPCVYIAPPLPKPQKYVKQPKPLILAIKAII